MKTLKEHINFYENYNYYDERNEWWLTDDGELLIYCSLKYFKENNIDICKISNVDKKVFNELFKELDEKYNRTNRTNRTR